MELVVWYPQKVVCILSLRGRTQSLPSLLNTVDCPSRYPMACLILKSRLSGLKRTHYWVRDNEKSRLFGLKKNFRLRRTPSSGMNLLKWRVGLRRPTESGLNCDRRTSLWYDVTCFILTSCLSDPERTQFWVRDNKKYQTLNIIIK